MEQLTGPSGPWNDHIKTLKALCTPGDPKSCYEMIGKVGQGASGSVYVARYTAPAVRSRIQTGMEVAIKQMDLTTQPKNDSIVNEIMLMKESQHPNIVNFLDSYLVTERELWVVMEYMDGGALTDVIANNSLSEEHISRICREVRYFTLFLPELLQVLIVA